MKPFTVVGRRYFRRFEDITIGPRINFLRNVSLSCGSGGKCIACVVVRGLGEAADLRPHISFLFREIRRCRRRPQNQTSGLQYPPIRTSEFPSWIFYGQGYRSTWDDGNTTDSVLDAVVG